MSSPDELLSALDDSQREAALALSGPVCILAGAGTGKTRAITYRIAYGIATGAYAPERILALTFTAKAAGELQARLRRLGAGAVTARTFHSAALSQLGYFWPHTAGTRSPDVLPGKARLLGQVAGGLRLAVDTATLRDVAAEIEWRKVSMLSLADYAEKIPTRDLPVGLGADALMDLMTGYEQAKDRLHRIDFEDVLLACAGMIEAEPAVALQVRTRYRFFVVDEFQDVSPLQERLLALWLGERQDLCVVGDAGQAIYSFAGARSSYLLDFERAHPGARVLRLGINYRSTPPILAAANTLMRGQGGAVTLRAAATATSSPHEPTPVLTSYATDAEEASSVAAAIEARIASGASPGDIAVLYRVGSQAAALDEALRAAGLPCRHLGQAGFFELTAVREAVMALRGASVADPGGELLRSVGDVLRSLGWGPQRPAGTASAERWDALGTLLGLAEEEPPGTSLRAFTDHLLERRARHDDPDLHAVTLGTIHAAKGLEWAHVHLVGLSEGILPIGYATEPSQVAEERRLLYVGITRARTTLALSWAAGSGRRRPREPSRFLAELHSRIVDAGDGAAR